MKTILITGMGRSGTTLIGQCLRANPDVFYAEESWSILHPTKRLLMGGNRMNLSDDNELNGLVAADVYRAYYSRLLEREGKDVVCEKCPPFSGWADQAIGMTKNLDIVFVWVVRNKYDVALSWLERFEDNALSELKHYAVHSINGGSQDHAIAALLAAWDKFEAVRREVEKHHNVITIEYEKFVQEPAYRSRRLSDVCRAARIRDIPQLMISGAFSGPKPGTGDKKFQFTNGIHSDSVLRCLEDKSADLVAKMHEIEKRTSVQDGGKHD